MSIKLKIVKRDGHIVDYNPEKIRIAIQKANAEVGKNDKITSEEIEEIIKYIEDLDKKRILVEDIQDIIEEKLMEFGRYQLAKKYITYRYTRELVRKANTTDQTIKELIEGGNGNWNTGITENNAAVTAQRDYLASITSSDIAKRFLLSEEVAKANEEGVIHFHDMECFAQNALHNSSLINLEDMLQNGTAINGIRIRKPKSFIESIFITLQILVEISSSSSGEVTFSLAHLAPFVKESYKLYHDMYKRVVLTKEECQKLAKIDTQKEIVNGIKLLIYGLNSLMNIYGKNPASYVFINLEEGEDCKKEFLGITEEFLKQKINALNGNQKELFTYPKIIYLLSEDNKEENSKYWYLTTLVKEVNSIEDGVKYVNKNDITHKRYGKFNQGTVTINLLDVAISSEKNLDNFWNLLNERLEICHRALQIRHKRLSNVKSDVAPILWQHGALARLEEGKSIHELLHHGYSTLSLGYVGLNDCVNYLSDDLSEEKSIKLREDIIAFANKIKSKWAEEEDIEYILLGIQEKAVIQKFVNCLKEKYSKIKEIADKGILTNGEEI